MSATPAFSRRRGPRLRMEIQQYIAESLHHYVFPMWEDLGAALSDDALHRTMEAKIARELTSDPA